MKFKNFMQLVASTAVMLGISAAAAFGQTTVTFDNVTAPTALESVTSGGPDGPTFVTPDVTFTGGVVIDGSNFFIPPDPNPATSGTNFYVTAYPNPLAPPTTPPSNNEIDNGTTPLPGSITGTLATPGQFQTISLDVINALIDPTTVTVTAFNSSNAAVDTEVVSFIGFNADFNDDGIVNEEVKHVTLNGSGISYFTVTSPNFEPKVEPDEFGIDTVTLTTPEPSTVAGLVMGCLVLGALVVKRKREMAKTNT